jgi:chemotaxis protein methyltransferase CheR
MALPATREAALRRAAGRAAPGLAPEAFVRAASDPAGGRGLVERLIDEITVQETSFLRDRAQLDTIAWHSLLEARDEAGAKTGPVRVWCVGCATGEEAYTLAMLAVEAFAPQRAPVSVLGTDISGAALAAAQAGRYRERAVRALSPRQRIRCLEQQADGAYLVTTGLRAHVRFRRHNVAREPAPPLGEAPFHAIVCRNVLIYFEGAVAERVIGLLEGSLRPGGMLVLGAADALHRTIGPPRQPHPSRPGPPRSAASRPRPDTSPPRATRPLPDSGPPGGTQPRPQTSPLGVTPPPKRGLRSPLGRGLTRDQRLTAALSAADEGNRDTALSHVTSLLAENPLDADAYFIHGLVALEAGEPATAAVALRRALYSDAAFALAAFTLGRAYDTLGDTAAARRAYQQALRTLNPDDNRHELLLQQIDIGDIAAACRARLGGRA